MNLKRLAARLSVLLLFLCTQLFSYAQEKTITGSVVDQQTGKPMEGVNVRIKNTSNGTTTNEKGEFTIKAPSSESIVSVTYVGYIVHETKVGSGSLKIQLNTADKS